MKLVIVAPLVALLVTGGSVAAYEWLASAGGVKEAPVVVYLSPVPSEVPTALPSPTLALPSRTPEVTRPRSNRHPGSDQGDAAQRMTPTPALDLSGCNQHLPDDMDWHPGDDPAPDWPRRGGLVTSPQWGERLSSPITVNVRLPQAETHFDVELTVLGFVAPSVLGDQILDSESLSTKELPPGESGDFRVELSFDVSRTTPGCVTVWSWSVDYWPYGPGMVDLAPVVLLPPE